MCSLQETWSDWCPSPGALEFCTLWIATWSYPMWERKRMRNPKSGTPPKIHDRPKSVFTCTRSDQHTSSKSHTGTHHHHTTTISHSSPCDKHLQSRRLTNLRSACLKLSEHILQCRQLESHATHEKSLEVSFISLCCSIQSTRWNSSDSYLYCRHDPRNEKLIPPRHKPNGGRCTQRYGGSENKGLCFNCKYSAMLISVFIAGSVFQDHHGREKGKGMVPSWSACLTNTGREIGRFYLDKICLECINYSWKSLH